ncbi:hypothetical protein [Microbulbifer sp. 2205BS26-8]|uniref:hypothetical protein n=1 Tax=Microbulbifer sp. 2205BS26-8 TaxID=3064386 RepID=UPI00273E5546|nr:hypothetical protein [Microbulbifer sp. 2205BS26-8]MDP5209850.1 hypothetical protein [Microbulbifer sp. 2205BS26-8]
MQSVQMEKMPVETLEIDRFGGEIQAPQRKNSYLEREVAFCTISGARTVRIPDRHSGQVLSALRDLGFQLDSGSGGVYMLAPTTLDDLALEIILTPLLLEGSRTVPETELAAQLMDQSRRLDEIHKRPASQRLLLFTIAELESLQFILEAAEGLLVQQRDINNRCHLLDRLRSARGDCSDQWRTDYA